VGFLTSLAIGLLFVAAANGLVLSGYLVARRLLNVGGEGDRTHDAAGAVAGRLAALHGILLALVYAQELNDYKSVQSGLGEEAVAVADIFNDVRRYGGSSVDEVQSGLAAYVTIVVDDEWRMLGRRQGLSAKAWRQWDGVYEDLLDLAPASDRERFLAQRMRGRITDIARLRQTREDTAVGGYNKLFWAPALIGLVLLAIPFFVYRPTRTHVVLIMIYATYSGVMLFFIYGFSNPYVQPGKLRPVAFEELLKGDVGARLRPRAEQAP
jgi:hypothetical protein